MNGTIAGSRRLHLVRLRLSGPRLFAQERELGLPARDLDLGYLVHCRLAALFGDAVPAPFRVEEDSGRDLQVLGYSTAAGALLQQAGRAVAADAADAPACLGLECKPMPSSWPAGTRLRFDTRVAPIIRKASTGAKHRKGAEVDAFLARCWEVGPDVCVDREAVYTEWLRRQLESTGAVRLLRARLDSFRRVRLLRRTQGEHRRAQRCERPDAGMSGLIEVVDSDAFTSLLARGVGRHRAFGFGMLLLLPDTPHSTTEARGC